LAKGLEVSCVPISALGENLRIDAQFYQKSILALDKILLKAASADQFIEYLTDGTHVIPSVQVADSFVISLFR
jgi:hypothetical protein